MIVQQSRAESKKVMIQKNIKNLTKLQLNQFSRFGELIWPATSPK